MTIAGHLLGGSKPEIISGSSRIPFKCCKKCKQHEYYIEIIQMRTNNRLILQRNSPAGLHAVRNAADGGWGGREATEADGEEPGSRVWLRTPKKTFGLRIKPLTFKLSAERAVDRLNDLLCCPCSQFLLTRPSPQAAPQLIHHDQSGHK